MRPQKIERGTKISNLPDSALDLLLQNPRGLDRLLDDLRRDEERERAEFDMTVGDRWE